MTQVSPTVVAARDLSTAWLETVAMVQEGPGRKMFHTFTSIDEPLAERPDIRDACDTLLADWNRPDVKRVANTIFPAAMAASSPTPEALAERYRATYDTLRRFPGNAKGTYFGRIVAYPGEHGPRDQLSGLIDKLRREAEDARSMSARYELGITAPDTDVSTPIHTPDRDNGRRAFPCLSMCSFQLDNDRVHLLAQYRYEYLIEKAYGNYLGLARLLEYVATAAELAPGRLTVVAGRIHVDAGKRMIERHLGSLIDDAGGTSG